MNNVLQTAQAEWIDDLDTGGYGYKMVPLDTLPLALLGVALEELPPDRAICPLHYHLLEEEFLYVLQGELTIRELHGDCLREFALRAGELIAWLPGTRIAHQTLNRGEAPARYLALSDRKAQEVAFYPESGKVLLRGAGVGVLTAVGQAELPLDAHFAAARALAKLPVQHLADADRPSHVVSAERVAEKALGRFGGFGRALSRETGVKSVFVNVDRLPPGARTSDIHAHLADEEFVFVLAGTPTLRQLPGHREGRTPVFDALPEQRRLAPGDAVHWAAGDLVAHQILNESTADVTLLVVGTDLMHDIVLYPERGQVYVAAIDILGSLRVTEYMAGESR